MNSSSLAGFQDSFAQALLADPAAPSMDALQCQPGFQVYRNTVMKGCIDALRANFPSVARLVGDAWFDHAAAVYVRQDMPSDARLLYYGERFPGFLAQFPPAAELPYLPGVASLDRFWIECHAASDDEPIEPAALLEQAPDALGASVLRPHASARWKWFDGMPVYAIWRASREMEPAGAAPAWKGEGSLFVRRDAEVRWMEIGAAHCAFLDACAAGCALADAAAAALEADAEADIAQLIAALLDAGALSAPSNFLP